MQLHKSHINSWPRSINFIRVYALHKRKQIGRLAVQTVCLRLFTTCRPAFDPTKLNMPRSQRAKLNNNKGARGIRASKPIWYEARSKPPN